MELNLGFEGGFLMLDLLGQEVLCG